MRCINVVIEDAVQWLCRVEEGAGAQHKFKLVRWCMTDELHRSNSEFKDGYRHAGRSQVPGPDRVGNSQHR